MPAELLTAMREVLVAAGMPSPRALEARAAAPGGGGSHLPFSTIGAVLNGTWGAAEDGTSLSDWLRARDVTELDVVGIATDHCVRATALDGVREGFDVRVLLDYTAGVAADTTGTAMNELRRAGVVLSGEPVVIP